jgi:histone H3/H4
MSLFTNQNFISQIIKQQGAVDFFDADTYAVLQALVEAETRKMVEKASKFMHSDRRDYLTPDDIENAMKDMGHDDLVHQSTR